MDPQTLENITKAQQCAGLLVSDIRQAHKHACHNDPVLEIVVRHLLEKAAEIHRELAELEGACK